MFNQVYRPNTFEEVAGQDLNIEVLKSIIRTPMSAPRCLIFEGDYGCGKSSCSRLFAKGLNCKNSAVTKRPCGVCSICTDPLVRTPFYQEFDSCDVGNKEAILSLKDDFFAASSACEWRTINLDEAHMMSRPAQSTLLKVLEDMPQNLFIIFCTTDINSVLDTIRSRSIELSFKRLSIEQIKQNLQRIISAENIYIEDNVLDYIAISSRGHVRDSVKLLDVYQMLEDKSSFLSRIQSSEYLIIEFFKAIKEHSDLNEKIAQICYKPLDSVRYDFYVVLRNMVYAFSNANFTSMYMQDYKKLAEYYGQDTLKLFAFSLSDWVSNSFCNDITVQAFFWTLAKRFQSKTNQTDNSVSSLLNRALKTNTVQEAKGL